MIFHCSRINSRILKVCKALPRADLCVVSPTIFPIALCLQFHWSSFIYLPTFARIDLSIPYLLYITNSFLSSSGFHHKLYFLRKTFSDLPSLYISETYIAFFHNTEPQFIVFIHLRNNLINVYFPQ